MPGAEWLRAQDETEGRISLAGAFLREAMGWLFPPRCMLCRQVMPRQALYHLCPGCLDDLPFIVAPFCQKCGAPLTDERAACLECRMSKGELSRNWSVFLYAEGVKTIIYRWKYSQNPGYAKPLALLLSDFMRVNQVEGDLLVPVPLHKNKLKQRGYNQAALLASLVAKQTGIPVCEDLLIRVRQTRQQSGLSSAARRKNVKDAFQYNEKYLHILGAEDMKHVVLVDDIYTTGSTLSACAQVLRQAGMADVSAVTLARTPIERDGDDRLYS